MDQFVADKDQQLQNRIKAIKESNFSYLAKLEVRSQKDLEQATYRKLLLIASLGLALIIGSWLIIYYGFIHKTYDECLSECEISSIKMTDDRDCKALCAKYK